MRLTTIVEQQNGTYKIYCDMDGVLTDFNNQFKKYTKLTPEQYTVKYGESSMWYLIDKKIGVKFWETMPWMPEGKKLWNYIKKYEPTILTSPSREQNSRIGKKKWVETHLFPEPKVIFAYSDKKQEYARKNSVLIDDKNSIIRQWNSQKGIGIQCKNENTDLVIQTLKDLGL